jgi:hypothetical protein
MSMSRPSIERLFEVFLIPDNGFLYRKPVSASDMEKFDWIGSGQGDGYFVADVDGHNLRVHVIIFAMTHRTWPQGEIDHANGIKSDNRPANLRDALRSQNMHNKPKQRNSTSGIKGVHWNAQRRKWQAKIMVDRKVHHLGLYDDPNKAGEAYIRASKKLLGEFSHAKP